MVIIYDKKLDVPVVDTYAQIGMPVIHAESYEQRLERLLEFEDKNHKKANVIAIRERPEGPHRAVKEQFLGANLVTTAGKNSYAEKASAQTPTNDFWHATNVKFALRDNASQLTPAVSDTYTVFTNPIAGSVKLRTAGYPQTPDADADNTGDGANIVSWKVDYTTTDFNATNVSGQVIASAATPTTGTPLLNHSAFTPFAKASTDTLKLFVNHTFS